MDDDEQLPGIPASAPREFDMSKSGPLDELLDVEIKDSRGGSIQRARAGLDGDWVAGSISQHVNWDDESTYDGGDMGVLLDYEPDGSWDDAMLLDDD